MSDTTIFSFISVYYNQYYYYDFYYCHLTIIFLSIKCCLCNIYIDFLENKTEKSQIWRFI